MWHLLAFVTNWRRIGTRYGTPIGSKVSAASSACQQGRRCPELGDFFLPSFHRRHDALTRP